MTEVTITAVIASVLAAVGVPNTISLLQGNRVQQGLDQVQNSLKDAQRQAVRLGQSCSLEFDKTQDPPTITPSPAGCLLGTDRELPDGVAIEFSSASTNQYTFNFSFKGTTTSSQTVIVKAKDGKGRQKCLSISNGLGIMRTGIYDTNRDPKCYRPN